MESEEAKIFVGGLLREVDEDALRQHFGRYGAVVRAVVVRDRITRNSRGHGFVWFSDPSSAKDALDSNEHVIFGKAVQVKRPTLRGVQLHDPQHRPIEQQVCSVGANGYNGNNGNHFRTKKIFVGGLPASLTRDEFKKFFERFGETTDVVIILDSVTRRPRGFGFITFESEESVEVVMQRNYYNLNGRDVEVKRAVPKNASEYTNGSGYANGHVGTGSESSQVPVCFVPYYSAYGAFPGYDYFPGYGKAGVVPYAMSSYWASPYPVTPGNPCYGPAPVYVNGFVLDSAIGVPNVNGSEMLGVHNQANEVSSNRMVAQIGKMSIEDDSPRIGDLKVDDDDDISGQNGDIGAPSC